MVSVFTVINLGCFIFSSKVLPAIGKSELGILTRWMGLIFVVTGTQMIISGLTAVINQQFIHLGHSRKLGGATHLTSLEPRMNRHKHARLTVQGR